MAITTGPYAESCDVLNSAICLPLPVPVGSSGSLGFMMLSSSRNLNLSRMRTYLLSSVHESHSDSMRTTHLYSIVSWLCPERMESTVFSRESATTGLIDTNEVSELVRIN